MFEKKENIIAAEFVYDGAASKPFTMKGIPSAPGLIFGKAFVIEPETIIAPSEKIPENEIENELNNFSLALDELKKEYQSVLDKIKSEQLKAISVLETNLIMISDEFFIESIRNRIRQCYSVENAVIFEFDAQKQIISKAKDSFLAERAHELEHIKEHLLSMVRHKTLNYAFPENSVVVSQSLTPTDIINFKEAGILAIITEVGGITSHTSLLARSFEIPAVIGIKDATNIICDGCEIIVDGYSGIIIINPDREDIIAYNDRKSKENEHKRLLGELIKLPSETMDGSHIQLMANVDFLEDALAATIVGSEGIGLVRSEQLILALNRIPDEEDQFRWYNDIAQRAYPNPVTIRVFDVGSDKYAEGMPKHENNPALGFRGIRFLMHRDDIFDTQIKAILRASKNKNVKIMLPMISNQDEIIFALNEIKKCMDSLEKDNISFDSKIPVGIMIETPAAALLAEKLAEQVAFFSIGTNDLTQYTLAVDRTNELVNVLFDSFHPAVLRLIKLTVDAANKKDIPVSVCGELAGHSASTELLIGMGIKELSVSPTILLELKHRVRSTKMKKAKKLARDVLKSSTFDEVNKILGLSKV